MCSVPSVNPEIAEGLSLAYDTFNLEDLLKDFKEPLSKSVRTKSQFEIPPSKKDRGKPYYVDSKIRVVMTKTGSHFPVHLKGIQKGDVIRTRVLYNHEDYETERVKCDNPNSGHTSVFELEPRSRGLEAHYLNKSDFCSKTLVYSGEQSDVCYRFVAKCLNSCTKICPERIVVFEHLTSTGEVLETSVWALRVCSIPKRDFEFMIDSVDPTTGEKRKSLYSKVKRNKKEKLEDEDLTVRTPDNQENDESNAYLSVEQEAKAVLAAAEWVESGSSELRTFEQSSSTAQDDPSDLIINVYDTELSTSLLEEKRPPQTYKTDTESTDAPPASMSGRPPMYVQLNSMEDEDLVRKLIHRLKGTVHELKLTSS